MSTLPPMDTVTLTGVVMGFVQLIKPVVPEKVKPWLPIVAVVAGGIVGSLTPVGWIAGVLCGMSAAGVYASADNIVNKRQGPK